MECLAAASGEVLVLLPRSHLPFPKDVGEASGATVALVDKKLIF